MASRRVVEEIQDTSSQRFRRSSTMSSVRRPAVDAGSTERQLTHELKAKRRKVLTQLSVTMACIIGVIMLLGQLTAKVNIVTPGQGTGDSSISTRYTKIYNDYLADRPLERLRFLADQSALHAYLLVHAPEIQSADLVAGDAIATSDLRLSFRQPALQWVAADKKYYVDGQGVTFEKNYFPEPAISVEDKSGVTPEVGQAVVDHRFLGFLGQVSSAFEASGVRVDKIILPENTVRQVDFGIEGRGYVVRMTVDRGVAEQTQRAVKSMEFLQANGISPSYIDARVDQRVFYK